MVEELYYLVRMKKRTAKEPVIYFVCTKNRRDEFSPEVFHGVGYWHAQKDGDKGDAIYDNIEYREEEEVWIPYSNIKYIKSLMYRSR